MLKTLTNQDFLAPANHEMSPTPEQSGEGAPRVVIIGSGFGGLGAALRMRAKGYHVTILERNGRLGGRAQVFEREGYRHDAGPTVITAPFLFDELFELFGKKREDYVEFVELDPWYRFWYPDGSTFDYGGTVEDTLAEIRKINPEDCDGYLKLLEHSRKLYEAGFTELSETAFTNVMTMVRQIPVLGKLRSDRTVWQSICKHLKHPKLRQAFSIQPLLIGGSPFDTSSIYGLIHYLERKWGVWFAMGGTGAVVDAFAKLMNEEGVVTRLNSTVREIEVEDGKAKAVIINDGERIEADILISNADPMHLYKNVVPAEKQATATKLKAKHSKLSMGLFVIYFGTTNQYPDVAHHTIWLGKRYKELLDDIFKRKVLADDFSLYVHRPTATDPSFAPEGHDSFYVLCPVPNQQGNVDWKVEGPKLVDRIMDALDASMLPGVKEHMVADFYMTPDDFGDRYLSDSGAAFSVAPYFSQSAWFRFHNRSEGIENLYLTGAGTHPGAGVPGVLCSAKVIDNLIPRVGAND